jgi:two-component system OmpR family sensor kinase
VTVRAHQEDGVGLLEVADAGPGMTGEQAAKVFDRFYRVDKARSRAVGGAGLGLAIVASIAEAHGGQASVKTREGKGTTFTVAIPLAAPPPDAG